MRRLTIGLIFALLILTPGLARAQAGDAVIILAPQGGAALQGQVQISGSANPEGFFAYELAFGYADDPTGTWFIIFESFNPVEAGTLAEWDTFSITDGDYDLRLLVTLTDASEMEIIVQNIRIRNYTIVETSTPAPTLTATPVPTMDLTAAFIPSPSPIPAMPTASPLPTIAPTHTPLPANPAQFRPGDISLSLARGAAGVLAAFLLLGIYTSIRNARSR